MSVKTNSFITTTNSGLEVIRNIPCPDGIPRNFRVQGVYNPDNDSRFGFVSVYNGVKQMTVSGIARRVGKGWKFVAHVNGKNTHLVRPKALPIGTFVEVKATGVRGVVAAVGWDYMTPTYCIKLKKQGSPKSIFKGDDITTV